MGNMMINENKIKLVTGVGGGKPHRCYTYPPKCLYTTILQEKVEYHKI